MTADRQTDRRTHSSMDEQVNRGDQIDSSHYWTLDQVQSSEKEAGEGLGLGWDSVSARHQDSLTFFSFSLPQEIGNQRELLPKPSQDVFEASWDSQGS